MRGDLQNSIGRKFDARPSMQGRPGKNLVLNFLTQQDTFDEENGSTTERPSLDMKSNKMTKKGYNSTKMVNSAKNAINQTTLPNKLIGGAAQHKHSALKSQGAMFDQAFNKSSMKFGGKPRLSIQNRKNTIINYPLTPSGSNQISTA